MSLAHPKYLDRHPEGRAAKNALQQPTAYFKEQQDDANLAQIHNKARCWNEFAPDLFSRVHGNRPGKLRTSSYCPDVNPIFPQDFSVHDRYVGR